MLEPAITFSTVLLRNKAASNLCSRSVIGRARPFAASTLYVPAPPRENSCWVPPPAAFVWGLMDTAMTPTMGYGAIEADDSRIMYNNDLSDETPKRTRRGPIFATVGAALCIGAAVVHATSSPSADAGAMASELKASVPSVDSVESTAVFSNPSYTKVRPPPTLRRSDAPTTGQPRRSTRHDHRPPTTDHRPPTTDHPTTDHPTTDHRPPTTNRIWNHPHHTTSHHPSGPRRSRTAGSAGPTSALRM